MLRIHLISGPRNISTALMYSFAQRADTEVVDEPFYACYLTRSCVEHPGKTDVLQHQSAEPEVVWSQLFSVREKPVLFIKNMSHHLATIELGRLDQLQHVFLIRDPAKIIASYAKVIPNMSLKDIGIEFQTSLFFELWGNTGKQPRIVDADVVLGNPRGLLSSLCEQLNIPFEESMLSWTPGPKRFDGVWAKYWYTNVHRSTGFEPPQAESQLPAHLMNVYHEALSYYQKLLPFCLKP